MRPWLFVLCVLAASPAVAQPKGPSFDCAKAVSAIDRTICKDADLGKADRALVAAYTALLERLKGAEREALVKDQGRWVATRNRVCQQVSDEMASCLKQRYVQRTATLQAMAQTPFVAIGEQTLSGRGRFDQLSWSYEIAYPRFEAKGVDFAATNTRFAGDALKSAQEATPSDLTEVEDERTWDYQQGFDVARAPGGTLLNVAVSYYAYTGGAHGNGATLCQAIDLRSGRIVAPAGLFVGEWRQQLYRLVVADLRTQFKERPGDEDSLKPDAMNKMLGESTRYCWGAKQLEILFNPYEVGPYAAGPYSVELSYERLKPLLRADGPIAQR